VTDAIGKPTPSQLVELLANLDPESAGGQQVDVDAIGRALDPTKLRRGEFTAILEHLDRLAGTAVDLSTLDAHTFAALIGRAGKDQLRDALARPALRTRILGEIFRRMPAHLRPDRARSVTAVVHWRFPAADDYERYETIIENGTCATGRDRTRDARVTITVDPYDFVRLITSHASAPVLFMTGKLKVRGDLAFAAGLVSLFDLPRP
jgi:alkyl sulfatase BDS1-like metallo-beta-lactamase superfamily hydrolase